MRKNIFWLMGILLWILLAIPSLYSISTGAIPFWYDPARDMLSAWGNLTKLTLIGPTSGIPGFFYGPYWIWLLSFSLLISKDPRFTSFVAAFVPYMILFPIVLYQFRRYFPKDILLILWALFILGFKFYSIFIWNPYISLLLFLLSIYLVLSWISQVETSKSLKRIFLAGIIAGLALNVNMSFGSVFILSLIIFFVLSSIFLINASFRTKLKAFLLRFASFLAGTILTFLPFLIFELRHGFVQTKIALKALVSGGGIIGISGMSKAEIVKSFFTRWAQLLQLPFNLSLIILAILVVLLVLLLLKKKISFSLFHKSLILLIISIAISCFALYLSVKNPIWDYHFIGVEVIWILLLGIFLTKIPFAKFFAYCWIAILIAISIIVFLKNIDTPNPTANSLAAKEKIAKIIINDAGDKNYSVYAYNPSIYSYDYFYLSKWLAKKDVSYDPGLTKREGYVYLILPAEKKALIEDFINYRTPSKLYRTIRSWNMPDKTLVLKRIVTLSEN